MAGLRRMLNQIQPGNIKKAKHVNHHPEKNAPTQVRHQHDAGQEGVKTQDDLNPDHRAERGHITAVDLLSLFGPVANIQLRRADKCSAFAKQPLQDCNRCAE